MLKVKIYVHWEWSGGGLVFSLAVDRGGVVVQWLRPRSSRLLCLPCLRWFVSAVPPQILVHNMDLTDSWRGKTHILSRLKTFTALTISKATSICYYNILTIRVISILLLRCISSSCEWISSGCEEGWAYTGSLCSWLSLDDLFLILNRWRSHIQNLTKDPTSTLSSLG